MMREWRHLHLLKQAGRGYDPNGVSSTKLGELTHLCPACPQPGLNLNDDWQVDAKKRAYVFLGEV